MNEKNPKAELIYSLSIELEMFFNEYRGSIDVKEEYSEKILSLNEPILSFHFLDSFDVELRNKHAQVIIDNKAYDIMFDAIKSYGAYLGEVCELFFGAICESDDFENHFKLLELIYALFFEEVLHKFKTGLISNSYFSRDKLDKFQSDLLEKLNIIIETIISKDGDEVKIQLIKFLNKKKGQIVNDRGGDFDIGKVIVKKCLDYDRIVSDIFKSFVKSGNKQLIDRYHELVPASTASIDDKIKRLSLMK